jgi:hypothetical protein
MALEWWQMSHRCSIEELQLIAHAELMRNRSITTYTFDNGVERRRPADPLTRYGLALQRILNTLSDLGVYAAWTYEEVGDA